MAGIVHAYQWDRGDSQYFVSLGPARDELSLYESAYKNRSYTTEKRFSRSEFDSIGCYAYSIENFGLAACGQSNGTIHVMNLSKPDLAPLKLRPKQSRPCNAISFNSNGIIAAGLDKVRNDGSLLLWNIEHYATTSSVGDDSAKKPIDSFLPNEMVSSTTFLKAQPNSLLCGSYKFIREIDLRSPTPVFQCATKCTHGITVNHFDDHYFASYSEEGSVAVWDRRLLKSPAGSTAGGEPALYMSRVFSDGMRKTIGNCFRYSLFHSDELAILNDGDLMRRWKIGTVPAQTDGRPAKYSSDESNSSRHTYLSKKETLFVSCVLDSKTDFDKVSSFDYTTDMSTPYSVNFMCIRQSGQVFRMNCVESPDATCFDPYNDLAVVDPERITIIRSERNNLTKVQEKRKDSNLHIDPLTRPRTKSATTEEEEEEEEGDEEEDETAYFQDSEVFEGMLDFRSVLHGDISSTIRRRALLGYSLDCKKNVEILSKEHSDSYLKYAWEWITWAQRAEDKKSMITDLLDLGFEGVLGIWEGSQGLEGQKRAKNHRTISDKEFDETVSTVVTRSSKRVYISTAVSGNAKQARRRLCLKVAGWNFDLSGLEQELQKLEAAGKHEQAAGWAVFHGDVGRAVKCLGNSKKERLRVMSGAVAGYLAYKDSTQNSPWREQCRRLASELDDPYLRAIFAFISDGSWLDVLDEGSLPLVERLGIAFRFLSDNELTVYLNRMSDRAIQNGDLEGIMLTGITCKAVPLLQSYVDKTSDVQTASLIISYGYPRFFEDNRVRNWIEDYRGILNRWRLFSQRAKFDVGRTRLSKDYNGVPMAKPIAKQVYLRCSHCKKTIGGSSARNMSKEMTMLKGKTHPGTTRCQSCGNQLPRCAVCLLSLGSPLPTTALQKGQTLSLAKQFEQWPTFCLSCNHGLHAGHAREWFSKHDVCPVPDCSCLCNIK
ncbi:SEH-associated protein 4 [Trichomonascus vanleenenianus]|uniref:Sea4p n=1 Tax=Trichomonascus vanleenenianus TaxID=2268995 RepID=UPI003ECA5C9B